MRFKTSEDDNVVLRKKVESPTSDWDWTKDVAQQVSSTFFLYNFDHENQRLHSLYEGEKGKPMDNTGVYL